VVAIPCVLCHNLQSCLHHHQNKKEEKIDIEKGCKDLLVGITTACVCACR